MKNGEIKFRAWDKKDKKFRKDVAICEDGNPYILRGSEELNEIINKYYQKKGDVYGSYNDIDFSDWYGIEYIEISQYTGLKDKEGKENEIYDKDIFNTDHLYASVEWINDGWCVCWGDGSIQGLMEFLSDNPNQEIIGNIYENPELLEK